VTVPFLFSAILLVIGLYVRLSITESPVFAQVSSSGTDRVPLAGVLRRTRSLVLACAVGIGPFAPTALISSYMISYAKGIGYHTSDVMTGQLFASATALLTIPLFSALSDRVGRRSVIVAGAVSVRRLVIAMVLGQVMQSAMYAPLGALLSEMFDTRVRYTGISMGYQLAALIGAGFTPLFASSLLAGNMRRTPLCCWPSAVAW
jgi:MFS family permease